MSLFTLASQVIQPGSILSPFEQGFKEFFIALKMIVTVFGSLAIFTGAVIAAYQFFYKRMLHAEQFSLDTIRLGLARRIILGLEFFVASDVMETMIAPDYYTLGILAVLLVIRTALNYTMQREINMLSSKSPLQTSESE